MLGLGVIDSIVPEPTGGAHRFPKEAVKNVGEALKTALDELKNLSEEDLILQRSEKFLAMGRSHSKKKK